MLKAAKVSVGRCMVSVEGRPCGKPAAYKQIFSGSRQFLFCEEHASEAIKKAANDAEEKAKSAKK